MACGEIRITRERKPADTVAAGSLVPVLSYWKPKAMGNIYFVYADRKYASPKVQAFIQMALDTLAPGASKRGA